MENLDNKANLFSWLPPFMAEYKELKAVLDAENPEFHLLWKNADRALYNQFIVTADEEGISSFERLAGLLPEREDSLEARRARVMNKWLSRLPYTYSALIERLNTLCEGDFTVVPDFEKYSLRLLTHLRRYGSFLEVKRLLKEMLPANILAVAINSVSVQTDGGANIYSSPCILGKHKKICVNIIGR